MDDYYKKYSSLPDLEIKKRLNEKKEELRIIFSQIEFRLENDPIKIAVLGCADRRLISGHREIFEEVLNKEVEIITFDIATDHLEGETGVVEHDCINPLPGGPFDITYAHILLKFIKKEKQRDVIKNSYEALLKKGIAIHVMDKSNYESGEVTLVMLIEKLKQNNIEFREIPVKYGKALVLLR
jgi:hypothetical protein